MLGWEIFVRRQPQTGQKDGVSIAVWATSLGGLDWIDALVAEGKATNVDGIGDADRWTISVLELRRALRNGLPDAKSPPVIGDDYMLPADWSKFRKFDHDLLDTLNADEVLVVEAWDQS